MAMRLLVHHWTSSLGTSWTSGSERRQSSPRPVLILFEVPDGCGWGLVPAVDKVAAAGVDPDAYSYRTGESYDVSVLYVLNV